MSTSWLVLYDGDCGLCKWLLAGLLRFDRAGRLRPLALQRPEAEALLADLDPVDRMASMHLVAPDGARTSGGEALPTLLGLLSGGRLPAAVLARFPRFTDRFYRWIATHRIGISRFVPRRAKQRAGERVRERELASLRWEEAELTEIGGFRSEVLDIGGMVCARHSIPAGFDSAPLYRGLPDDMCPCEHWCCLVSGALRYRFSDGGQLEVRAGDAFRLRAGHLADVLEDTVLIEFTPAEQYRRKAAYLAGGSPST